jgi:hypothetical protein
MGDSLSAHVADIEQHLAGLDAAFVSGDSDRIDQQCQALQRSLADSLVAFRQAEHAGVTPLSSELLQRLKLAQARVQAQQAAVHRANASIDRTLAVLLPREEGDTYGALAQSPAAKALKAYR